MLEAAHHVVHLLSFMPLDLLFMDLFPLERYLDSTHGLSAGDGQRLLDLDHIADIDRLDQTIPQSIAHRTDADFNVECLRRHLLWTHCRLHTSTLRLQPSLHSADHHRVPLFTLLRLSIAVSTLSYGEAESKSIHRSGENLGTIHSTRCSVTVVIGEINASLLDVVVV